MDAFDMYKFSHRDYEIRQLINATLIHDIGVVREVIDEDHIVAESMGKLFGAARVYNCTVVYIRTKQFMFSTDLKKGDKVLVLTLQYKFKDMFTSEEPVNLAEYIGYSPQTCIAIPVTTYVEDIDTEFSIKDEVSLVTKKVLRIEAQKDLRIKGETVIINDGNNPVARKGDAVKVTLSPQDIQTLASALLATGGFQPASAPMPGPSVTLTGGEIIEGSDTVKVD